jgi:hypothetical protein
LAEVAARGVEVDCSGRDIVGFPFALRLACDETEVAERGSGTQAQVAGLTGGASIFAPRTARIALASPARLNSPLLVGPATVNWDEAEIDVGMGLNGPRAVAFEAESVAAELPVPAFPRAALTANTAAGTLAPATDGGTDATLAFSGLALAAEGAAFPPFDGTVSGWLSPSPRALMSGRAGLQAPLSLRGLDVLLSSGAARLQAQGDLAVDAEGILDGIVTLRIAGADDLPKFIAALPQEHQKLGNAAAGGLIAFGKASTLNGEPASELTVEIVRGRARVGPVEVEVPKLPI